MCRPTVANIDTYRSAEIPTDVEHITNDYIRRRYILFFSLLFFLATCLCTIRLLLFRFLCSKWIENHLYSSYLCMYYVPYVGIVIARRTHILYTLTYKDYNTQVYLLIIVITCSLIFVYSLFHERIYQQPAKRDEWHFKIKKIYYILY